MDRKRLSPEQRAALRIIRASPGPLTVGKLAELAGRTLRGTSQTVYSLERVGLVARDRLVARSRYNDPLEITADGEAYYDEYLGSHPVRRRGIPQKMTPEMIKEAKALADERTSQGHKLYTRAMIAARLGVAEKTLYRALNNKRYR